MPADKGDGKGENHRAVIARIGVIRRVRQELMTEANGKWARMRKQLRQAPGDRQGIQQGDAGFHYQHALRGQLAARPPQPQAHNQQRHNGDEIAGNKSGEGDQPLGGTAVSVDQQK